METPSDERQNVGAPACGRRVGPPRARPPTSRLMVRFAETFVPSRAVAEEVAQEAWLGVIKGIDKFEGRSSLSTWIFRIVANIARTRGERERRTLPTMNLMEELARRCRPCHRAASRVPDAGAHGLGHRPAGATFPTSGYSARARSSGSRPSLLGFPRRSARCSCCATSKGGRRLRLRPVGPQRGEPTGPAAPGPQPGARRTRSRPGSVLMRLFRGLRRRPSEIICQQWVEMVTTTSRERCPSPSRRRPIAIWRRAHTARVPGADAPHYHCLRPPARRRRPRGRGGRARQGVHRLPAGR